MKNGSKPTRAATQVVLDDLDRRIVAELLGDGRISHAELGRRVNLSPPAVADRVRRLEQAGVIIGYRAEVDPRKLGYSLTALVRVRPAAGQLSKIAAVAAEIPQVVECHRVTGEDCFHVKLLLHDIDELSELLDRFLVHGTTTTSIVNGSPIPRRDPPVAEHLDDLSPVGREPRHPPRPTYPRLGR